MNLEAAERREQVLAALVEAGSVGVSGESLASALGCSRAAVHRHVDGLRRDGVDIVSAHDLGAAKEDHAFWDALRARLDFDPARTLFIDDNAQVRAAARRWGIGHLYGIARPDSHGPQLSAPDCRCLEDFAELTGC